MHLSVDVAGTSELNFEAWRALLRSTCGGKPQAIEPNDFVGWMRPRSVYRLTAAALKIHCGFAATDHGCSAYRYERTHRDVRLSGVDSYCALFQIASRRAVIQNDQTVQLAEGDIALLDGGQPATYVSENGSERWLALYLPRQALISYLGFEPQGVLHGRGGTLATRGLRRLVLDIEDEEPMSPTAVSYMQLALYDLLGALFAPSDPWPVSRHADKLFTRICGVIKDRFADPDFGPCEVWQPKRGTRCVTCRSSLLSAARPAVNSYIRFVWITPRAFYIAGRRSIRASLSARLPTPAAFATIQISPENFAIDSVARRAPTPEITPS